LRLLSTLRWCVRGPRLLLTRLFSYIRVLSRFKRIGPWHLYTILIIALFLGVNVYLTFFNGLFKPVFVEEASIRAANLSLINLVPVIAGPSQSFLASTFFGVSLKTFQKVHRSLAVVSTLLLLVHVIAAIVARRGFSLQVVRNVWTLAAVVWLVALIFLSLPWLRGPYELFARTHQLLSVALPFLIWQHLTPEVNVYFFIFLGSFPLMLLAQLGNVFYRNAIVLRTRKSEHTNAVEESKINRDIIQIELALPRPIRIQEGQYIGLWIPAVSRLSFLQVHPFMVTSWSDGCSNRLSVLVDPRRGWTKKLLRYTRLKPNGEPCRALFTGPYGLSVPTRKYGIVLLVAAGLGIVSHIPYLKRLIHDYNARRTQTRRICLVWLVKTLDLPYLFQDMLNEALAEDALDDGRILGITIYVESGGAEHRFGKRTIVHSGFPNLEAIFKNERTEENIKRAQKEEDAKEEMLVLVSATEGLRVELRKISQRYVRDGVDVVELEYQPDSD
ncbi:cell surface metalloreductase, partial [Chaetomium strumarium]